MKTPLFSTIPSESCKTFIITSVLPSLTCDCSSYSPPVEKKQTVAVSSTLPSSSFTTSVSSTSALSSTLNPGTQIEQQTTISSTPRSPSLKRSVPSSSTPSSIHNPPTQSEKETTVPSTCKPPTSVVNTTCLPNTCKHGGTCIIPGNYCKCQKVFAWHDCSVYIGSSTVEIELAVSKGSQWNLLDFKIAMATACTEFFCKTGECTSKSKSGKVKRSEGATFFQPSDIILPGLSSGGEKIWQVEFAILFPTMDGPAPQPMLPVEIIQMANESKGTIEKVVGGTIKRITATSEVEKSKAPDQPKNGEHQQSSNKDKRLSMSIWIAAGVGSIVALLVLLVAFGIYRLKRKRRPQKRKIDIMRLGITHVNPEFHNPTFDEDSIYDLMSRARGNTAAACLAQENDNGLEELRFQNDTRNKTPFDDRTYQALDETAMTRQAYIMGQHNTCWGDHEIEDFDIRCDSLQTKNVQSGKQDPGQGGKIDDPEKRYTALQQKKRHPGRGGEGGDSKTEIPRDTSGTVTMKMATYMSLQCQDESD